MRRVVLCLALAGGMLLLLPAAASAFDCMPKGANSASFSFLLPTNDKEYALSMQPLLIGGRPVHFLDHVFDYGGNTHTREVVGVDVQDLSTIYVSRDLGETWASPAVLPFPVSFLFTAASGARIAWDPVARRIRRLDAQWKETPIQCLADCPWLGSQSIGQHGNVLLFAEYWVDPARPQGFVWRSVDDGLTWDKVFSMLAAAAPVPEEQRIHHFHTLQPDPFAPGHWYLSSGDVGRENRVWRSADDGVTWSEVTDLSPEGTELPQIHRHTAEQYTRSHLLWATDDPLNNTRAAFVMAKRGTPLEVRLAVPATQNHVRSMIATDAGYLLLTENSKNWPVLGLEQPGVEIGLVTRKGRYLPVGLLPDIQGIFTASQSSRHAVDGVFFSAVRWNRPGAMLRWRLSEKPLLQALVQGGAPVKLDLCPLTPPLIASPAYSASINNPEMATVTIEGALLVITPRQCGNGLITVGITGAGTPPHSVPVRVLVYPAAHRLAEGPFQMDAWPPDGANGGRPSPMLPLRSDTFDPRADAPLQYAYEPPAGGAPESCLRGLGEAGAAFSNVGSPRDLGGLLLALDTRGVPKVQVTWTGGTLTPKGRNFGVRLQYRVGTEEPFKDVPEGDTRVEYGRGEQISRETLGPFPLPGEFANQSYVQLLWRYFYKGGVLGPRPDLSVDDIVVETAPPARK